MSDPIFISYAHEDQEFALKLASDLEDRNTRVWIDKSDIQSGAAWRDTIENAIQACKVFILVVSPNSIESHYVNKEITEAQARGKPIFPLIYRKTKIPDALKSRLFDYQFIDFRQGGYANNFIDLVRGVAAQGVEIALSSETQTKRRREHLGKDLKVSWKVVLSKIPGWAFAWSLGWAIFWTILPILLVIIGSTDEVDRFLFFPIGGFFGGFIGGLFAGLATMINLRHQAATIAWKHMRSSIRIWGFIGPLGSVAAGALAMLFFTPGNADCAGLGFGDCMGAEIGQALGDMIGIIILIIFYAFVAISVIGGIAGGLAVRHIRRLEPGILGKQAIWIIISWSIGANIAALAALIFMSMLDG